MKKILVYAVPFTLIAGVFLFLPFGEKPRLFNYEHILLQVCINIAIFAINFSFLQYQFAPYRALQRRISAAHIWASVWVLLVSLLPLLGIILAPPATSARLMLFIVPIEMALGIGLCLVADDLASPYSLMRQQAQTKALDLFIAEYSSAIQTRLDEDRRLELSKPTDMPDFEWGMYPLPDLHEEDPFQAMASLGLAAISNNDLAIFERVIQTLLRSVAYVDARPVEQGKSGDPHRVKTILMRVCFSSVRRLADAALESPNRNALVDRLARVLSDFFLHEAAKGSQTKDLAARYIGMLERVTIRLMRNGSDATARLTLKTARQAAQKGLDAPNESDFMFALQIPYLVGVIKRVGQEAISTSNSDLAYRCFDALGWLGCSAVKKRHEEMSRTILQALVQLGREVRQSKLQCFDPRCALVPFDHLTTRLEWMATWVCSLEGDLAAWTRMFARAYSRLYGVKCEASVDPGVDQGKKTLLLTKTSDPYTEMHTSHEGKGGTVDYSNPNVLKDMVLY